MQAAFFRTLISSGPALTRCARTITDVLFVSVCVTSITLPLNQPSSAKKPERRSPTCRTSGRLPRLRDRVPVSGIIEYFVRQDQRAEMRVLGCGNIHVF